MPTSVSTRQRIDKPSKKQFAGSLTLPNIAKTLLKGLDKALSWQSIRVSGKASTSLKKKKHFLSNLVLIK